MIGEGMKGVMAFSCTTQSGNLGKDAGLQMVIVFLSESK